MLLCAALPWLSLSCHTGAQIGILFPTTKKYQVPIYYTWVERENCGQNALSRDVYMYMYRKGTSFRQAPVFRHLRALLKFKCEILKAHGSFLSEWMIYNYTACCWFPTSSNILILPSQFWQIRFESCWLHCSKCRILVLLRYTPSGIRTM